MNASSVDDIPAEFTVATAAKPLMRLLNLTAATYAFQSEVTKPSRRAATSDQSGYYSTNRCCVRRLLRLRCAGQSPRRGGLLYLRSDGVPYYNTNGTTGWGALASQAYVDSAVAGINPATAVSAATTAAGNTSAWTYNNGVGGIGATFTGPVNTAIVIDGFTFNATTQSLLVKDDTQSPSGAFNGIYSLTALQTVSTGAIFTRRVDYDTPSDINNTGAIPVLNGTANGTTQWVASSNVTTVGTSPLTFAQFPDVELHRPSRCWRETLSPEPMFWRQARPPLRL